jgi:uncharacterized protein (DUF2235 family)
MRNIVVCCDGTGNEISENISNLLKFYRALRKTERTDPIQVVFYDPGVGTLARPNPWTRLGQNLVAVLGLATGYKFDDNLLRAYDFLVDHYEEDDRIFLFGFSRGAHTVRALAALIHKVGLLLPQQKNLSGAALTAYKQLSDNFVAGETIEQAEALQRADDKAAQFARIASTRWPTIRFVGVWDTVASVIVPRRDKFPAFSLERLAFTDQNPSVETFRHAIAVDERRRMFRLAPWRDDQQFVTNRFNTSAARPQDVQQVWFAGVHADIGGGYPEMESALSKFPLIWMIDEAQKYGLSFNPQSINQLAWGRKRKGSPFDYVAPDHLGRAHDSMTQVWRALEFLPKSNRYKEESGKRSAFGHYLPMCEARVIPDGAMVHQSVVDRAREMPTYKPENLPSDIAVVPYQAASED